MPPASSVARAAERPEAAHTPAALARLLLERNLIDVTGLERAKRVAAESGARLDLVMTQLGLISERTLAETLSDMIGAPLAGPPDYPQRPVLPDRLKLKFLRRARAVPIAEDGHGVTLALADPLDPFTAQAAASRVGRPVRVAVAVPIELEEALNRLYAEPDKAESGDEVEADGRHAETAEADADRLKDLASEAPVIRLVNQLIARAVESRASDIHIEPFEDRLRVRYRHDGLLHEVEAPPAALQAAVVSRIKIMSRLDIAERRLPQDGRIKLVVRGHEIDFRVSTIPGLHGESVVLRVLDRTAVEFDFGKLGLADDTRMQLLQSLGVPNGIILVTGPTGSGKTTTLYTALLHLNSVTRKVITVEDPVEYQLAGINQVQVKPQIGLNFAALLRSILRHDPDIIMIGEIRDLETAEIAVQASLTGHLVLSTLHTNSAAATVTRLRDMGLEDYLLAATVNGILAQRLVRRLCQRCKRPVAAGPEIRARLGALAEHIDDPVHIYEAAGCPACKGTGFAGRVAIAEFLPMEEPIRRLILQRADQAAIHRAAAAAGMRPLYDSGVREVLAGVTTLPEVLRSIREDG
ncbi:MAG: type II secretion system ATPase GspE [Alphaproteobacteria bacterium]|nr:type II secretion system ATPase GspE [Alphaproteobacteria bacterium]